MRYLPLHFDVAGRRALLVGGGEVALRKAELLLRAGALLRVVAPHISPSLTELLANGEHETLEVEFAAEHLDGCVLAVAATSDDEVNRQVHELATNINMPVNVVDFPKLCTFVFPAIIDRDPLVMSVGSGGGAPVLTRTVRGLIEAAIPAGFARLAAYLGARRDELKARIADVDQRRRHTEAFLDSPGANLAMQGKQTEADEYLLAEPQLEDKAAQGEVYLVGAGPGDPDLLTLKALHLMQRAEVVLHDHLVSDAVLDRVRRDATRELVGKRSGYQSTSQEHINELLVRLAKEGKRVLRLKGGDPFVFGRGGEELTRLIEERIPFEVVPGITAATGCAAYAGIPLTHRELAQSVRFVTAHPKDGKLDLPWHEFAQTNETLVFYMGLGGLATICGQLISEGRAATTPIAIVSRGTLPDQRVLKGTLETIAGLAARAQIQTPTLIIVGDVVEFAAN